MKTVDIGDMVVCPYCEEPHEVIDFCAKHVDTPIVNCNGDVIDVWDAMLWQDKPL
jgi:hypothetical protein